MGTTYRNDDVACYITVNEAGLKHNSNGPAVIYDSGTVEYWIEGKRHRDDGPAIVSSTHNHWYIDGKCHRVDGPAVERKDGTGGAWYLNDEYVGDRIKNYCKKVGIKYDKLSVYDTICIMLLIMK